MAKPSSARGGRRLKSAALLFGIIAGLAVAPTSIQAQEQRCAAVLTAPPAFDDDTHRRWYRRFWTGSCEGVSGMCMSGSPNWNEMLSNLTAAASHRTGRTRYGGPAWSGASSGANGRGTTACGASIPAMCVATPDNCSKAVIA